MNCPYCKSSNIKTLKVHISKPIGAKKHACLNCNQRFITNKPNDNNSKSTQNDLNVSGLKYTMENQNQMSIELHEN